VNRDTDVKTGRMFGGAALELVMLNIHG